MSSKSNAREPLPKTMLSFQRTRIPADVWTAWDQRKRNWQQVLYNGSVMRVDVSDFAVEGWMNPVFGWVTLEYMCRVDPDTMKPTEIVYEHHVRHNGAVHNMQGGIAGTPSGFTIMIRRHTEDGRVQIGTIREFRPIIQERLEIREDGTYLDRFGDVCIYTAQPEDFEVLLHVDQPLIDASGIAVARLVMRPGVTVEGGTGGWGTQLVPRIENN